MDVNRQIKTQLQLNATFSQCLLNIVIVYHNNFICQCCVRDFLFSFFLVSGGCLVVTWTLTFPGFGPVQSDIRRVLFMATKMWLFNCFLHRVFANFVCSFVLST